MNICFVIILLEFHLRRIDLLHKSIPCDLQCLTDYYFIQGTLIISIFIEQS